MKIAISATEKDINSDINPRFGRAKYFLVYETETGSHEFKDNLQNMNAGQGAGIQTGQNICNWGAQAVITGHVGPKSFRVLSSAGIDIYLVNEAISLRAVVEKFKNEELQKTENADVEGHWV